VRVLQNVKKAGVTWADEIFLSRKSKIMALDQAIKEMAVNLGMTILEEGHLHQLK
jgi:hypothetical protein